MVGVIVLRKALLNHIVLFFVKDADEVARVLVASESAA